MLTVFHSPEPVIEHASDLQRPQHSAEMTENMTPRHNNSPDTNLLITSDVKTGHNFHKLKMRSFLLC